jgi:hypothetical protein
MTHATPSQPRQQPGDVSAALVDLLYRQSNAVLFANFVIALPVFHVLRPSVPVHMLFGWMAAVYLLTTLRIGLSWRYFRHRGDASPQAWARRFMVLSWLSSLLWGAVGSSILLPPEPQLVAFCCIVLAGMSSGAIPSLSAHPATYRGSVAGMLLPSRCTAWCSRGRCTASTRALPRACWPSISTTARSRTARCATV